MEINKIKWLWKNEVSLGKNDLIWFEIVKKLAYMGKYVLCWAERSEACHQRVGLRS